MVENKKLPDHIKLYFDNIKNEVSKFIEILQMDSDDYDLKTEINKQEIVVSNVIHLNHLTLLDCGVEDNIFHDYDENYLRRRASLNRQSRNEFVQINKTNNFEDNAQTLSNLSNIQKVKE